MRGSKSRVHQPADEHSEGKAGEPAVQQGRQLAPGQAVQVCHYKATCPWSGCPDMLKFITGRALMFTQPTLRHSPPRLHSKGRGRSPVTLRIAPSEPYSPFKRFSSSSERSNAMRRGEEMGLRDGNSTDPRWAERSLQEISNHALLTI